MVYLLFFLSGFAGLVYEISWSRQIGLLFGHTVYAGATVLGAYFAGMALGNWIAARLTSRHGSLTARRPLAGYGYAELIVALWAIATPLALGLLRLPGVAELLNSESAAAQTGVRALAAFLLLLPATVPLGATLPFIAQHVSPPGAPQPRRIALAYALNTVGALTGVLAATYALILYIGVTGSSYLAAALSAGCGLAALLLARRPSAAAESTPRAGAIPTAHYVLAAVTGFGTLGLQVLYNRLFALILHNSTYSFGTIVVAFLLALALAALAVSRVRDPARLIGPALLWGASAIPAGVALLVVVTRMNYLDAGAGFLGYMALALGLVLMTIVPPVFLLGLVLPALWSTVRDQPGHVVGRLTAVNTISATLGVLTTVLLIMPLAGTWPSFALFTALFLIAGWLHAGRHAPPRARLAYGAATLAALGLALFVGQIPSQFVDRARRAGIEYLYQRDTPYGQVDVVQDTASGNLVLRQNRYYRLGATEDQAAAFELRQGALPLLLHPAPRQVCYLGLATGITASAALHDPAVEHLTVVELIPEVVVAARLFEDYTGALLDSPRSRIVVNDARHFLYAAPERFDLIVSDLFVPWHSQTGYLYTAEHYRLSAARLADGGVFFQWLPPYQLSRREMTMIMDTFASVFPHVSVWLDDTYEGFPLLGLSGSTEPLRLDPATTDARAGSMSAALGALWPGTPPELRLGAAELRAAYAGDWSALGGPLNTDEHPRIEFLAPVADRAGSQLVGQRWQQFQRELLDGLPRSHP